MKISQRAAGILAGGLFTIITLFAIWVPFLTLFGFDLIQASIQDGLCNPIGPAMYNAKSELRQAYTSFESQIVNVLIPVVNNQTQSEEVFESYEYLDGIYAKLASLVATEIDSDQSYTTPLSAEHNKTLKIVMWVTLAVVVLACSVGIRYLVNTYKLNWSTFLIRNFITLVGVLIVELTLFGGVAMRYVPWNMDSIINGVLSEL